jgi:hypothetical protein
LGLDPGFTARASLKINLLDLVVDYSQAFFLLCVPISASFKADALATESPEMRIRLLEKTEDMIETVD